MLEPMSLRLHGALAGSTRACGPYFRDLKDDEGSVSLAQLLTGAREEIGRLQPVLQQFSSCAGLRTPGGDFLALSGRERGSAGKSDCRFWRAVPLLDPEGRNVATLELVQGDHEYSEAQKRLLKALLAPAVDGLAERWFRMRYSAQWIMLAVPHAAREIVALLAMDRHGKLIGADAAARRMLTHAGLQMAAGVSTRAVFKMNAAASPNRAYRDCSATLAGVLDGQLWDTLTTPPAAQWCSDANDEAILHARPRGDAFRCRERVRPERMRENGLPSRILCRIEDYIDANLANALNIEALAASAGISASHFARCFRASRGVTPHAYVMQQRLARAQQLLARTDLPLSEVALCTGFADQSHFSRRFHHFIGLPPRSFRLQHR